MAKSKILMDVPSDKVFWLCDGRILKNFSELVNAFETMNDEIYAYHANAEKNDFANWVRDVIGDKEVADKLVGKDRAAALRIAKEALTEALNLAMKGKEKKKELKTLAKKAKKVKKAAAKKRKGKK